MRSGEALLESTMTDDRFTFSDYVQRRLRCWKRTPLLKSLTHELWSSWMHPPKNHDKQVHLVRAYAPRIVPICIAACNEHRDKGPTTNDIYDLCYDYNGIKEIFSYHDAYRETVVLPFIAKLSSYDEFAPFIPDEGLARELLRAIFLVRLGRSQWEARRHRTTDLVKHWWIFRKMIECQGSSVSDSMKICLGVDPVDAIRGVWGLFTIAQTESKKDKNGIPNGVINILNTKITDEVKKALNVDVEALQLMAARISLPPAGFKTWYQGLSTTKEHDRKYFPNPLVGTPLLELDSTFDGVGAPSSTFSVHLQHIWFGKHVRFLQMH